VGHLLWEHKQYWGFLRVKDIRFWWMDNNSENLMINYGIEETPADKVMYPTNVDVEMDDLVSLRDEFLSPNS
jgi:hypothetical protein